MEIKTKSERRIMAKLAFFLGLLLILAGFAFLLGSRDGVPGHFVFLAFFLVFAGCGIASFAIKLNKRAAYLFFASFSILAGIFLFLSSLRIVPIPFSQSWPLISVFAGLALVPAGWRKYGSLNLRFLIPSAAFIGLGAFLLAFSLHILNFSFKQFMLNWWPLLVLLAGLLILLVALCSNQNGGEDSK